MAALPWIALIGSLGWAGWPDLPLATAPKELSPHEAAVVIAIEDYGFLPDVAGAAKSGTDWFLWLNRSRGIPSSQLKLLKNAAATDSAIRSNVVRMAAQPGVERLWVVFIGHGVATPGGELALVGVDAQATIEGLYPRSVPWGEIEGLTAKLPEVVAVLDASFSGRTAQGPLTPGAQPALPGSWHPGANVTSLRSSSAGDLPMTLPGLSASPWSYLLLGGLWGWANTDQDDHVNLKELATFMSSSRLALTAKGVDVGTWSQPDTGTWTARALTETLGPDALISEGMKRTGGTLEVTGLDAAESEIARLERELAEKKSQLGRDRERSEGEAIETLEAQAREEWARLEAAVARQLEPNDGPVQDFVARWSDVPLPIPGSERRFTAPEVALARAVVAQLQDRRRSADAARLDASADAAARARQEARDREVAEAQALAKEAAAWFEQRQEELEDEVQKEWIDLQRKLGEGPAAEAALRAFLERWRSHRMRYQGLERQPTLLALVPAQEALDGLTNSGQARLYWDERARLEADLTLAKKRLAARNVPCALGITGDLLLVGVPIGAAFPFTSFLVTKGGDEPAWRFLGALPGFLGAGVALALLKGETNGDGRGWAERGCKGTAVESRAVRSQKDLLKRHTLSPPPKLSYLGLGPTGAQVTVQF